MVRLSLLLSDCALPFPIDFITLYCNFSTLHFGLILLFSSSSFSLSLSSFCLIMHWFTRINNAYVYSTLKWEHILLADDMQQLNKLELCHLDLNEAEEERRHTKKTYHWCDRPLVFYDRHLSPFSIKSKGSRWKFVRTNTRYINSIFIYCNVIGFDPFDTVSIYIHLLWFLSHTENSSERKYSWLASKQIMF